MTKKKLLKTAIVLTVLPFLCLGFYIGYVFSGLNRDIDLGNMGAIVSEVKSAKKQNQELVNIYNRIHKNALEKSSWLNLWERFMGEYNECPCFDAVRMTYIPNENRITESAFVVAVKIEKQVDQRDCLNYIFENYDYLYGNRGVEDAAKYYFNKSINRLNEEEMIGLVVMLQNPSLYNPKRFREKFDRKVRLVKKDLKIKQ